VFLAALLLVLASASFSSAAQAAPAPERLARRAEARDRFLDHASERARILGAERRLGSVSIARTKLEPLEETAPLRATEGATEGADEARTMSWSPYVGPFALPQAGHLMRRAVLGPQLIEMRTAATRGLGATVDGLLNPRPLPGPPAPWALEPLPDLSGYTQEMFDSLFTVYFTRMDILRLWWGSEMASSEACLQESMTLFWHDHFATGAEKAFIPASMYKQNQLFREYAVGNFRNLVQEICVDPAMIIWLDGNSNYAGNENENFARELLELFALGVGHYSQADVVAASRAFTGYFTYDGVTTDFEPWAHDYGQKTFLGQTGPWFGPDIVEIIFEQPETARFLCRKLYKYFIDENPNEALIEDLAQTLRANDYEVGPVLERMFSSQLFFDPSITGALYTDGMDKSFGLVRAFDIDPAPFADVSAPAAQWAFFCMYSSGQYLLDPPNVGGWPGYRSWVNSYTLPWRRILDVALVDGEVFGTPIFLEASAHDLALQSSNPNSASKLVDEFSVAYLGMAPTPLVRTRMIDELLQGMNPNEWNINLPGADDRVRDLLRLIIRLPNSQLE